MRMTRVDRVRDLIGPEGVDGGVCRVVRDGQPCWLARTPNGHVGDLSAHTVVEHDDGTITVTPSILVTAPADGAERYHGFLVAGEWRPA